MKRLLSTVCAAQATANKNPRDTRVASLTHGFENKKWGEIKTVQHVCVCMCVWWGVVVHRSHWEPSKTAAVSYTGSTGQLIFTAYIVILKGKVHTQETAQLTYSIHSQLSQQFSFFLAKPQLPHCWFSSPFSDALSFFFFSFSERCVTGLWFSHYTECTGSVLWQNRSLSLFPPFTEGHRAKFNITKITVAQNTHFHIQRGSI